MFLCYTTNIIFNSSPKIKLLTTAAITGFFILAAGHLCLQSVQASAPPSNASPSMATTYSVTDAHCCMSQTHSEVATAIQQPQKLVLNTQYESNLVTFSSPISATVFDRGTAINLYAFAARPNPVGLVLRC